MATHRDGVIVGSEVTLAICAGARRPCSGSSTGAPSKHRNDVIRVKGHALAVDANLR